MSVDFLLAPEAARDDAIRPIVEQAVAFVVSEVGPSRLDAVILTGSLSRGEASLLPTPSGFRLLGDVEFLVAFKDASDWTSIRRQTADLSARASRQLGANGTVASIEYGAISPAYLRRKMRPCIFAYDLLTNGKVLWGRRDILADGQSFPASAIPPDDAIVLVMNRMVELLEVDSADRGGSERAYHAVKIMLDLAGSALAFTGRYVSHYAGRVAPCASLLASLPALDGSLVDSGKFLERLSWAVQCKHCPSEALLLDAERDGLIELVARWAKALWVWEVGHVLNRNGGAAFSQLVEGYLGREPLASHLKGWAKFWLHPLRPRGALQPLRHLRLFGKGSPHALTYAAALLLYEARFGDGEDRDLRRARSLLPVPLPRGQTQISPRDVCDLWHWLVRNG